MLSTPWINQIKHKRQKTDRIIYINPFVPNTPFLWGRVEVCWEQMG